jgi:uncharacterized protein YbjT (DUF2867 family)
MHIFLTGASGNIGGSVAAALLAAGHPVSGLARTVNAGEKMRRRAGVKMYRVRTPEAPRGGLRAFGGDGGDRAAYVGIWRGGGRGRGGSVPYALK